MKFLVTVGTLLGYLLSFLYPFMISLRYYFTLRYFPFVLTHSEYFAVFWEHFVVVLELVWVFSKPYLGQALEVLGESSKRAWVLFLEQDKWNIFFEVMTPISLVLVVLLKKEFVRRKYVMPLFDFNFFTFVGITNSY
jgi:hypothetical protein